MNLRNKGKLILIIAIIFTFIYSMNISLRGQNKQQIVLTIDGVSSDGKLAAFDRGES